MARLSTPIVGALAIAEVAIVAGIALTEPNSGAFAVVVALLLAPVAVWAVAGIGGRLAGPRFAVAAAAVYDVLPLAGRHYFYGDFVRVYNREVVPAFVGLRSPGWFALGIGVALVVYLAPERVAGVAGIVAAVVALALWVDTDWTDLYGNLHETTWSPTLLCLLPVACVLGAGLRRPWLGAALGGWLTFFVLRGAHRNYYAGGFWFSVAAAAPAVGLLVSSLWLLVPRLRPEPAPAAAEAR